MSVLTAAQAKLAKGHIERLARQHHIEVHWSKTWRTSECDPPTRQVFLPKRIRTGTDYLVSLHEFGHVVDPVALDASAAFDGSTRRRDRGYRRIIEEAAAWAWAKAHASPTVLKACTEYDWANVGWCWAGYVALA